MGSQCSESVSSGCLRHCWRAAAVAAAALPRCYHQFSASVDRRVKRTYLGSLGLYYLPAWKTKSLARSYRLRCAVDYLLYADRYGNLH